MLTARYLKSFIQIGRLRLITADGKSHVFSGPTPGKDVTVRFHDRRLEWTIALNPELRFGEAYMDGRVTIEHGTLRDFLYLANENIEAAKSREVGILTRAFRSIRRFMELRRLKNPPASARRNVSHHYDLTGALFDLFLDPDKQYSCAYFTHPDDTLEEAQERKKRRLAAKLLLEPDHRVLDIGSGWGGLAMYLHQVSGCDVTGVTLSHEQAAFAATRVSDSGVSDSVRFELKDYRHLEDSFDRIVSVGMFEHVGPAHYQEFFEKTRDLLKDDGVAVLHSIGRFNTPEPVSPWIERYIFPGGYTPALSEVLSVIERTNLWVADIEILRLHYAETLKVWYDRFMANRDKAKALYDERFCRMWEFYLAGCEMAFRTGSLMVFQIQFAKDRAAVPLTRDYITEKEHEIARSLERRVA